MYLQVKEWKPKTNWKVEVYINNKTLSKELNFDEVVKAYCNYYIYDMCQMNDTKMALWISKKKVEYRS